MTEDKQIDKKLSTSWLVRLVMVLGTAGIILLLDRITKILVVQNVPLYDSWEPIPALGRIFQVTHILNSGAAFGMFQSGGGVFMIVAIIVSIAIVYFVFTYPSLPLVVQFSLGLQLGGALGNLWDRIQQGSVVDFIDIGFWPIFNIADISIVTGVAILAIWLWQEDSKQNEQAPSEAA